MGANWAVANRTASKSEADDELQPLLPSIPFSVQGHESNNRVIIISCTAQTIPPSDPCCCPPTVLLTILTDMIDYSPESTAWHRRHSIH
jgi:hypothetical protein